MPDMTKAAPVEEAEACACEAEKAGPLRLSRDIVRCVLLVLAFCAVWGAFVYRVLPSALEYAKVITMFHLPGVGFRR